MDLFNLKVEEVEKSLVKATFLGESYEEAKKVGAQLIHWIPVGSGFPCEVVMSNSSVVKGVAEDACRALKPNEIIQFQRFGFVRVDQVNGKLTAYFAHR
jgi:glutamyl-tRNA synthetase